MNQFARPGLGVTELPPVNADDNGKVLGVSDGAWAKVAASGGSDLPDDPAQDGTYNLQNTVSSGTGTLSWSSGSSGGGVLVVHVDADTGTVLDKTWAEIYAAAQAGPVILLDAPAVYYLVSVGGGEGEYFAAFFGSYGASVLETRTDSESGYPIAI